jgi:hypothetical protein
MNCKPILTPALRAVLVVLVCVPALGISSFQALFAPNKDPWPRWQADDPASRTAVDHAAWDRILKRHLQTDEAGINRFDYVSLNGTGRRELDDYIAHLARQPVSGLNRDEQLAFWVNLYNALTVRTVAEAYPVDSIRDIDISPGLFADGPWGKKLITVEGVPLSLNDIEHRILRPLWDDPRIHYALNCAALGCPNLAKDAYTGARIDRQLNTGARLYINSPRGAWFKDGKLWVSSIYAWFQEDFGGNDAGILAHLRTYAEPDLGARLEGVTNIRGHGYDWGLAAAR